jgi:PEGA domain
MCIQLRKMLSLLLALVCLSVVSVLHASDSPILAEVRFHPRGSADKNAGVWVDGQYIGYVKELNGTKKIMLLPGKHEIVARQAWYHDYVEQTVLEPGEVHNINLALTKDSRTPSRDALGELKISAAPRRAVVFIDDQFAGHVDEFDGVGKALLLTPGKHHVRIALPGYLPFETVADLRPHQKLKIETELVKGSITEAGALVSKE